jgi:hypothetical protein
MLVCFASMTTLTHFTRQSHTYLTYFFTAFALYLVAVLLIVLRPTSNDGRLVALIFAFALLHRVPLWFTPPTLSTDVWRYLWDGRLVNNGVNPYAQRVDSAELDYLATPLRERIDNTWMASPYPPGAQVAFAAIYAFAPESPTAMQVAFSVFDLATGGVLVLVLRHLNLPRMRVLLYLWNPLVVVEFAHSAHIDSLMTFLVMLAIFWLLIERKTQSMVALALATLTKLFPALLVPVFLRRWGIWRTLAFVALVGVAFAPFLGAGLGLSDIADGTGVFGAARIYARQWKTNDGLFFWLTRVLEPVAVNPVRVGKLIGLVVLGGIGLWVLLRFGRDEEEVDAQAIIGSAAVLISVFLLLSTAVFPWYLTWLIALLPLLRLRQSMPALMFAVGWLYFSAAVNLSYVFYLDPANPGEIEWVRRAEYLPLFAFLSIALFGCLWPYVRRLRLMISRSSS